MLDTKPCGLWLLMTIVYLGEREEGIVRETEAFMGGMSIMCGAKVGRGRRNKQG